MPAKHKLKSSVFLLAVFIFFNIVTAASGAEKSVNGTFEISEKSVARSNASHSWEIDKITVEPVAGSEWISPLTKKSYTLEYRIRLNSSTLPGELYVKMAETQEIGLGTQWDYQGLGKVTGTVGGSSVGNGRCWIEVEELSLPAVNKMK